MIVSDGWKDYEVIDTANGEKLERWGSFILRRPDPQVIWNCDTKGWNNAHASYHRSSSGGGNWEYSRKMPESWIIKYKNLSFNVRPTGFKHTGLFPEQASNWDFLIEKIQNANRKINVLNLFGYTGGATVAAAFAGAKVCHVDASKGMVSWAKENIELSGLSESLVRFIVDDVLKFVQREQRRENKYEVIIMDPPSYGRGPNKEIWKLENELYNLVEECFKILSDKPLLFIINSYTTGLAPSVLANIIKIANKNKFKIKTIIADEIGLPVTKQGIVLPCGSVARCEFMEEL